MIHPILVVEDQSDIRRLIRITLDRPDFQLHEAANGDDGLAMARELKPKVLLLDVMLPGSVDGLQICSRVKADPALQSTRVVMLTARSQGSDIMHGFQCGADAYLTKPFSPLELLETVEHLVSAG